MQRKQSKYPAILIWDKQPVTWQKVLILNFKAPQVSFSKWLLTAYLKKMWLPPCMDTPTDSLPPIEKPLVGVSHGGNKRNMSHLLRSVTAFIFTQTLKNLNCPDLWIPFVFLKRNSFKEVQKQGSTETSSNYVYKAIYKWALLQFGNENL